MILASLPNYKIYPNPINATISLFYYFFFAFLHVQLTRNPHPLLPSFSCITNSLFVTFVTCLRCCYNKYLPTPRPSFNILLICNMIYSIVKNISYVKMTSFKVMLPPGLYVFSQIVSKSLINLYK